MKQQKKNTILNNILPSSLKKINWNKSTIALTLLCICNCHNAKNSQVSKLLNTLNSYINPYETKKQNNIININNHKRQLLNTNNSNCIEQAPQAWRCEPERKKYCRALLVDYDEGSDLILCLLSNVNLLNTTSLCTQYLNNLMSMPIVDQFFIKACSSKDQELEGLYVKSQNIGRVYRKYLTDQMDFDPNEPFYIYQNICPSNACRWKIQNNNHDLLFTSNPEPKSIELPPSSGWVNATDNSTTTFILIYPSNVTKCQDFDELFIDFNIKHLKDITYSHTYNVSFPRQIENIRACNKFEVFRSYMNNVFSYTKISMENNFLGNINKNTDTLCNAILESSEICTTILNSTFTGPITCGKRELQTNQNIWWINEIDSLLNIISSPFDVDGDTGLSISVQTAEQGCENPSKIDPLVTAKTGFGKDIYNYLRFCGDISNFGGFTIASNFTTPTLGPTKEPTIEPTISMNPTKNPTIEPIISMNPTKEPTIEPTISMNPTKNPTLPTLEPTHNPTFNPTNNFTREDIECNSNSQIIDLTCKAFLNCNDLRSCFIDYLFIFEILGFAQDCNTIDITNFDVRFKNDPNSTRLAETFDNCLIPHYSLLTDCCKQATNVQILLRSDYDCSAINEIVYNSNNGGADDLLGSCTQKPKCTYTNPECLGISSQLGACEEIRMNVTWYDCNDLIVDNDCNSLGSEIEIIVGNQTKFLHCTQVALNNSIQFEGTPYKSCRGTLKGLLEPDERCVQEIPTFWDFVNKEYNYRICENSDINSAGCGSEYNTSLIIGNRTQLECLINNATNITDKCCNKAITQISDTRYIFTNDCEGDAQRYCNITASEALYSSIMSITDSCIIILSNQALIDNLSPKCNISLNILSQITPSPTRDLNCTAGEISLYNTTLCPTLPPTNEPTISPTTISPTTDSPTTDSPTTSIPTISPTTDSPTTSIPTISPTTSIPTISPTTDSPTTSIPTISPTTDSPTTSIPTISPTTDSPIISSFTDFSTTISTSDITLNIETELQSVSKSTIRTDNDDYVIAIVFGSIAICVFIVLLFFCIKYIRRNHNRKSYFPIVVTENTIH